MKTKKLKEENVKVKRAILYILLLLILSTIFIFSGENGQKSNNTSDAFTGSIIDKVSNITNKEISDNKKKDIIINTRFIVRKAAHFSIYFILGIIVYLILSTYNINKVLIISIIICFILGCLDEFHQVFIAGRTARFYDCIIDTLGSSTGIIILDICNRIRKKKQISVSE